MGYFIETSGRIRLPAATEHHALTVLEVRLAGQQGWFHQDEPVDTLDDLARFVGATLVRDGDWLTVGTDHEGDPKWSEQATAFYLGLEGWVSEGEVRVRGEDGQEWGYHYFPGGVSQLGVNGWDGTGADPAPGAPPSAPSADVPVPPSPEETPSAGSRPPEHLVQQAPHLFDDPDVGPPGGSRTFAMAMLLVAGVVGIIAVAMMAAGLLG